MHIVAIGGGEIGRPGTRVETAVIDREIVRLTGQPHPRLLFIPTASHDSRSYAAVVRRHFGQRLGCRVETLYLLERHPARSLTRKKISRADIIYVGGGNTLTMLRTWRKLGVDRLLRQAARHGTILAGVSAGSICWFQWGASDYRRQADPSAGYAKVTGLGLIPSGHCPHYDSEPDRQRDLKRLTRSSGAAIALDDCSALEIVDGQYRILTSKPTAQAYKIFWRAGKHHRLALPRDRRWRNLKELLNDRTHRLSRPLPR